jgi:hypothetical protein
MVLSTTAGIGFPCAACANAIVNAGIKMLVARRVDLTDPNWAAVWPIAVGILADAGVVDAASPNRSQRDCSLFCGEIQGIDRKSRGFGGFERGQPTRTAYVFVEFPSIHYREIYPAIRDQNRKNWDLAGD